MDRITQKDLECLVGRINEVMESPLTPYSKTNKEIKANIGNYHLDYAYSGVRLAKMVNEHGGISVVSDTGYGTKRELWNWMRAFLAGLGLNN